MPDFNPKGPPKRTIIQPAPQMQVLTMHPRPQVGILLDDIISIYQTEILKLKIKSNQIGSLSATDATILQGYMKSLTQAAKEVREKEREAEAADEQLTDAELLAALELETTAIKARLGAKK